MKLPEPSWRSLDQVCVGHGQKPITRAVDREAKRRVIQSRGRRWTRAHDLLYVKLMVKWGYLPAEHLEREREIFQEERAQARQARRDAGLPAQGSFRVW